MEMFTYVLVCVCWTMFMYWVFTGKYVKLPPSFHGALPIVGHAHLLLGNGKVLWNFVEVLGIHNVEKGGVTHIRLGPQLFYVISDPDDYVTVMNTCLEKNYFYRRFLNSWVGEGLVTASVPVWKRISKLLSPAFKKHVFNEYIGVYNSQARSLADELDGFSGIGPFDPKDYINQTTIQGNILTTFGLELNEDNERQIKVYKNAGEELIRILTHRMQNLWMHNETIYSLTPSKRKEDENLKTINYFSYLIMAQKKEAVRKAPKINNVRQEKGKCKSFLDLVLQLSDESALTDREILDEVNTMMFAGSKTTATTLTNLLVIIGSFPEVQERIYEELQEVFAGTDRDITIEDLPRLAYMEVVIKEVCRLYPVAPVLIRYVDKDVKLKNYTMQAGSNCILLVHTLNRDKIWGSDSEEFRPERWLENSQPPSPDIYTGFGAGRRVCTGRLLAIMIIKITLAHLLRRYKISGDHTKLEMDLHIILEPTDGFHISIESRN